MFILVPSSDCSILSNIKFSPDDSIENGRTIPPGLEANISLLLLGIIVK